MTVALFALAFCSAVLLEGCGELIDRKNSSDTRDQTEKAKPTNRKDESKQDFGFDEAPSELPHTQKGSLGGTLSVKQHSQKPASDNGIHIDVPFIHRASSCEGSKIGIYSWDQDSWKSKTSPLARHLAGKNAHATTCGDVYVNVADYSNPHHIYNSEVLVPFIKNVRRAGNSAVVFLTYGDVETKNTTACRMFIDTFFRWVQSISSHDMSEIRPIGVSFDIEHFPFGQTEKLLKYAQQKKAQLSAGDVVVQWTIEGRINPVDTDAVMRYADSALMMAYRNYMSKPDDVDGSRNGLLRRMQYMLREQCSKCLNDDYASLHYKAKITIMIETACHVAEYCDRVSFCAHEGGAAYVVDTLAKLDDALTSSGLVTEKQKARLFNKNTMFSVHHWEWFQCYYKDPTDSNKLCTSYGTSVKNCKSNS